MAHVVTDYVPFTMAMDLNVYSITCKTSTFYIDNINVSVQQYFCF